MEYTSKRRRGRTVPFGYAQNANDPWLLDPVPAELDALRKAITFLNADHVLDQVRAWLVATTKRSITSPGLKKVWKKYIKDKNRAYEKTRAANAGNAKAARVAKLQLNSAAAAKKAKEASYARTESPH